MEVENEEGLGVVEVDETFVGGVKRGIASGKFQTIKPIVVGTAERGGDVRLRVVGDRRSRTLVGFIRDVVTRTWRRSSAASWMPNETPAGRLGRDGVALQQPREPVPSPRRSPAAGRRGGVAVRRTRREVSGPESFSSRGGGRRGWFLVTNGEKHILARRHHVVANSPSFVISEIVILRVERFPLANEFADNF